MSGIKGLNLDQIIASLEQEKTAAQVFTENALGEGAEEVKEDETVETVEEVKEAEENVEDAEEKTAEEETATEETEVETEDVELDDFAKVASEFSEWKTITYDGQNYEYKNVKEAAEIMTEKDLPAVEKLAKLKEADLIKEAEAEVDEEAEELRKIAELTDAQGKILARSFFDELTKLSSAEAEVEEIVEEEVEEAIEETKEAEEKVAEAPEINILTNLYNQYYGE